MNRQLALLLAAFAFACSMEAKTSDRSGPTDPQLGTGDTIPRSHQPEERSSNAAQGGTSGTAGLTARKPASSSIGGVGAASNATRPSSGGSVAKSGSHQVGTATGGVGAKTNSTQQSLGSSGGRSATNTRVAPSGASGTAESSGGARSTSAAETGDALSGVEAYLAGPRASRQAIEAQAFSKMQLTREQANRAAELLWKDYAQFITDTRRAEHNAKTIKLGELSLR